MASSCTASPFIVPPEELNIEYAVDFHREINPNHPVLLHSLGNGELRYYKYAEVVPAVHRAGKLIARRIGFNCSTTLSAPVVVILGPINNLLFFTIILGLLRAGITGFPISPRFSANVVARLVDMVRPTHILVNDENSSLGKLVVKLVFEASGWAPTICKMPTFEELYLGHNTFEPLPRHSPEFDKRAFIVHSSSSTSLVPKAIYWNANFITRNGLVADSSAYPVTGKVIGSQVLEFFHSAGLYYLFWVPRSGFIMATISPHVSVPLGAAGSEIIFQSFEDTKPDYIWASPRLLEPWSQDPLKLKFLSELTAVAYAGRFLNKVVGDVLVESGVKIVTAYGSKWSAEFHDVSDEKMYAEFQGEDWEYFTLNSIFQCKFVPRGDGALEVFVSFGDGDDLPVVDAEIDGAPAYATRDLALAHPSKPGLYKLLGRINDQIMLSTGEFVNPIPIEDRIRNLNEYVISALVFGHGQSSLGVIVQLGNEETPGAKLWETVVHLWPSIAAINRSLPVYARIQQHMILIASADKPFQFTQKGSPRRPMILSDYQVEIDALYASAQFPRSRASLPIRVEGFNKLQEFQALAVPVTGN